MRASHSGGSCPFGSAPAVTLTWVFDDYVAVGYFGISPAYWIAYPLGSTPPLDAGENFNGSTRLLLATGQTGAQFVRGEDGSGNGLTLASNSVFWGYDTQVWSSPVLTWSPTELPPGQVWRIWSVDGDGNPDEMLVVVVSTPGSFTFYG